MPSFQCHARKFNINPESGFQTTTSSPVLEETIKMSLKIWFLIVLTLSNRNIDCKFIHHSNDIYKCRKYKFELEQFQDLFFFSQLSLSLHSFFSVLIFFLLATSDWAIAVERSFSWCCWQTEITPLSFSTSVTSKLPLIRAQRKSSNAESVPLSIPVVLTFPRVLMKMSGYVSSIFSDDSYSTLPDDLLGPAGVHNEVNDPGDDSQHVGQNLKYQQS